MPMIPIVARLLLVSAALLLSPSLTATPSPTVAWAKSFANESYQIVNWQMRFSDEDLRRQMNEYQRQNGDAPRAFDETFKRTLTSIFEDGSDAESPLALAALASGSTVGTEASKKTLLFYLNDQTRPAVMRLVQGNAEHGENSSEYWIFRLTIRALSDHIFWILTPKEARSTAPTFNYGFN